MRILLLCTTHYQLIVAIQLRLTLLKNDYVGVCVTDHSQNSDGIVKSLMRSDLFDRVHHLRIWEDICSWSNFGLPQKLKKFFELNFGARMFADFSTYDQLYYFNTALYVYEIADSMCVDGRKCEFHRMEEGLISCNSGGFHLWRQKIMHASDAIRHLTGRPRVADETTGFYCFIPELCDSDLPQQPMRIPSMRFNRDELIGILQDVFCYTGFPYEQEFIYFASAHDVDGTPIGETELVLELAEKLGRENLLVKMHPRDSRSIFQQAGISVMRKSYVPWEVIQLCEDLSNRTLISCTSGAPLAITALLDDGTKACFLKPRHVDAGKRESLEKGFAYVSKTLNKLHSLDECKRIYEMDLDEFFECCTKLSAQSC